MLWQSFFDRYWEHLLKYGRQSFPYAPSGMEQDVFQDMCVRLKTNPYLLSYRPIYRFRYVLARKYRNMFVDALRARARRDAALREYVEKNEPLIPSTTNQTEERHEEMKRTLEMIHDSLMRPDFPNGRYTREFRQIDLELWRDLQRFGAKYRQVAAENSVSIWAVFIARCRVRWRVEHDARAILVERGAL